MSFMYTYIGIKHFTDPQYFINITPPQIHYKSFAVYFTGALEILGGLLILKKSTRKLGAFMLIFLLIIVFPANIYLYISEVPQQLLGISKEQALIRMPFQAPLIILAYWHSKENHPKWGGAPHFLCCFFLGNRISNFCSFFNFHMFYKKKRK